MHLVACCAGTLIEWFDFTVYSQLSGTITAVFFPASNPAAQDLAFWGVYATGFIARPSASQQHACLYKMDCIQQGG